MTLAILGLFSGIGGLELGIERGLHSAGVAAETVAQCEIAEYPRRVLAKHWPTADRYTDVQMLPSLIRERRQRQRGPWKDHNVDIICGGFPCQDISVAGAGAGLAGSRSGLFFDLMRVVRVLRPSVIVLENVPAVTSRGGPEVAGAIAEAGYDAAWAIVSAADVGAPHLRERWFCVAWRPMADVMRGRVYGEHVARASGRTAEPGGYGEARTLADAARPGQLQQGRAERDIERRVGDGREAMANVHRAGLEIDQPRHGRECATAERGDRSDDGATRARAPQPGVVRTTDGLPCRVDGRVTYWPAAPGRPQFDHEPPRMVLGGSVPHRRQRIKGLGNAVVPAAAEAVTRWGIVPALRMAGVLA